MTESQDKNNILCDTVVSQQRCLYSCSSEQLFLFAKVFGSSANGAEFEVNVSLSTESHYFIETFANASSHEFSMLTLEIFDESGLRIQGSSQFSGVYHSIQTVMQSGKQYYFRVHDAASRGGTYSIRVSTKEFGGTSTMVVADPDFAEPKDNDRVGATALSLNAVSEHSLSVSNGEFGGRDWFEFVAS